MPKLIEAIAVRSGTDAMVIYDLSYQRNWKKLHTLINGTPPTPPKPTETNHGKHRA